MIQDGPWNKYRQQAPATAAPARIMGAPKAPDPIELQRLNLSEQANRRAEEASRRADEANTRANAASERQAAAAEKQNTTLTEAQGKATGFYTRARGAEGEWKTLESDPSLAPGTQPVGMLGDIARAVLPENVVNNNTSAARQRAQQAKENFIAASLRLESGAAIGPAEFARQDRIFYPQTGDSPETIAQKARARELVIEGFKVQAGPGAERLAEPRAGGPDTQLVFNDEVKPVTGYRLAPEQESQIAEAVAVGDEGQALALLQKFSGNPPTPETVNSVRSAIKNKGRVAFNYGAVDRAAQEQADIERYGDNLPEALKERQGMGVDATVRGIADVGSLGFADELSAAATTLFSGGTMKENLQRERAIDEADRRVNGGARFGGQLAGGVLSPIGRSASTVKEVTAAGGASGALYGFGSGDSLKSRATGALGGGFAGATGGYVIGKGTGAVRGALAQRAEARAAANGLDERNALLQAADRQQVDLMPADVGGPLVRRATSVAAQAPLSASSVIKGGQRVVDQSRAARDRVAEAVGEVLHPEAAGEVARSGGQRFIAATRQQADHFYDRAEKLAEGAKITPARTLEALDRNIAELSQDPSAVGGSHLNALQKLRDAIGSGQLSVSGIRSMRSRLRQQLMDDGLRSSDFQRRVGEVVDSASEDLTSNLVEQGMEGAATAFRRADQFYRGRVEAIDGFLDPIIGKGKSGEQVMQALETAAKTNGRKLQGFVAALPNDERSAVQATIISRLGTKKADSEGADFSLDVFLSQWKAMTPRAKAALFPAEARSALDDLSKIASGAKAAAAYSNRSNTGGVVGTLATGGIAGNALWAPVSTSLALIGQYGAGKLLASPKFARWLAHPPKEGSPTAVQTWIGRIPQIPAVRNEIEKVQQGLLANLSASPSRVNASDRKQDRRPEPVND